MLDILQQVRWTDVVDIFFVSLLIWLAVAWVRRTRARFALVGLLFSGLIFLFARQLDLQLTLRILQALFAVSIIVLVVIFQDDLKRLFEQIAMWGLRRRPVLPSQGAVAVLVQALGQLARTRMGALVVVPGRAPLDRHLEGGLALDALVSEPLLLSIFDPHSLGHDGAAILAGERLSRFAVHLPLSADHARLAGRGTRHAAALGLAERTDALAIVVSEERGTVSVARDGSLRTLAGTDELAGEIHSFLESVAPQTAESPRLARSLVARWPEAVGSLLLSTLLWLLFVPGSSVVETALRVPIEVENLPAEYVLEKVEPAEVEVLFSGPRRLLVLADGERFAVHIDALLVSLGRRTFQLSPEEVDHPTDLEVVEIRPTRVRLSVRKAEAAPSAPQ